MTTDTPPRSEGPAPDEPGPGSPAAVTGAASPETVRRVGLIVLAALVFLIPAGVGVAVGASVLAAPTPTSSAAPAETPEAATEDPAASAPTPEPEVAPVDFASPSGNLRCHIDGESAYCHQGAFVYAEPSADCAAEGVAIGVDADGAYWPCLAARPGLGTAVDYDVPVVNGEFTCVINLATGARCTNADGAGFTIEYTEGVATF